MGQSPLWERIRRARVFQVLAVYLGASWVVLQIAEMLTDALELPPWVLPVAIILLLIGMIVILSTAWIQSMPVTTEREQAGELPTDWQIAPGDAFSDLLRGRLPHLTWGRAILGGVVSLSLLFGGTGLYVGFNGRSGGLGPAEAGASEAPEGIAVVPFDVRGDDLEIWREGMMDLLTNNLDGVGGFRTIDSRTVMARWRERVGDAPVADLDAALRVAGSTGARYAIEGSVVGLGDDVRLVANVYDLSSGEEVAQGQAQGPATDVLRLADELAVGTMRSLLGAIGRAGAGDLSAETMTTASLPALRAFLEGEGHYRKGRFAEAVQSFERAVAEDTAFAIALVRLSEAYGWLEDATSERLREYGERAVAHTDRLSPRYQFIMEGWSALNRGSPDGVESLKEAVQKYPDDPEAWFLLAETYIHVGGPTYGTEEELWEALEKAVELDPNFIPYLVHLAEWAIIRGDRATAEETLARYRELGGGEAGIEHLDVALPLLLGDSAESEAALASAREGNLRLLQLYGGTFARHHDRWDLDARMQAIEAEKAGSSGEIFQGYYAASMGDMARAAAIGGSPTVSPSSRGTLWGHASSLWDVSPPGASDPAGTVEPDDCLEPSFSVTCHVALGTAFARWERWDDHRAAVSSLRAEAERRAAESPEGADGARAAADVVEGAGLWRSGQRDRARELLEAHIHRTGPAGEYARMEMGWLEAAEGRPGQAIRHFRTELRTWSRPAALYGVATMLERLGQEDEAREHWRHLAVLTRTGDPLPRIQQAREAAGPM